MGCDIHFFVEEETDQGWELLHEPEPHLGRWGEWYGDRNYDLFAVLADVRNGRAFAGVDTGDGFVPMSPPRGLPADVSDEIRGFAEEWRPDGHSHSWFTLTELLTYDYDQQVTQRAYFEGKQLEHAERVLAGSGNIGHIYPRSGWSNAPGARQLQWEESYRQAMGGTWFWCLQKLASVAITDHNGDTSAVRAVFWFDN